LSDLIFPHLVGLSWEGRKRTPEFKTLIQTSVSGLDSAVQLQVYPRYTWTLSYDVLRSNIAYAEFQTLLGFFLQVGGAADTWLFNDWEDNCVYNQVIGTGDGSTTSFQMCRTLGGFTEPVLAVNQIFSLRFTDDLQMVTIGGQEVTIGGQEVVLGNTAPITWTQSNGVVTFSAPPPYGPITADFSYYWRCRFAEDTIDPEALFFQFWQMKEIKFRSVKLGSG
jgi:uncharacterized protein (TIGR02217 family)